MTLTTYALLRLDADALAAKEWRVVVLDEAQAIKNPDSQATRAAYQLKGGTKLAVSGTPLELQWAPGAAATYELYVLGIDS